MAQTENILLVNKETGVIENIAEVDPEKVLTTYIKNDRGDVLPLITVKGVQTITTDPHAFVVTDDLEYYPVNGQVIGDKYDADYTPPVLPPQEWTGKD